MKTDKRMIEFIESLFLLNKITLEEKTKAIESLNYVDALIAEKDFSQKEMDILLKMMGLKRQKLERTETHGCLVLIIAGISILTTGIMVMI